MEAPPSFALFPSLPTEIRLLIWQACLPHRTIELDPAPSHGDGPRRFGERVATTSRTNTRPPTISRVCRESSDVAFRHGAIHGLFHLNPPGTTDLLQDPAPYPGYPHHQCRYSAYAVLCPNPWIQPQLDTLHIYWAPHTANEFVWKFDNADSDTDSDDGQDDTDSALPEQPVELLHHLVETFASPSVSITAGLILPFRLGSGYGYDWVTDDFVQVWDDEHSYVVDLLHASSARGRGVQAYDVLLEGYTLAVHVRLDAATASGLFGVGGDERVRLVDVDDVREIERYERLWREHGDEADVDAEKFFQRMKGVREDVERWRRDVVKVYVWHRWMREKEMDGDCEMLEADKVWLGHNRWGDDGMEDASSPDSPGQDVHWERRQWEIDIESRELNDGNEWVWKTKSSMPWFYPKIMFRLCGKECYRPLEERPRLGGGMAGR
ncbi:hypothetical protein QBC34DRAFT_500007 [Podospora aff. communis PSN243]|uniref:2EXR domain-containing protein n=1 Tax=Podospora aff. communis PSN243 TaxID=3040156 RepID=A0AAV9G3X7_9PEZI|nr:hypothetical protein QBC34DRAFT_500007 [Podospora aff. communis PSN243]